MVMNSILIVFGMTLLVAICIAGSISSGVMVNSAKPSYWCITLTEGYTVQCCMFVEENGELEKYCTVCADTNPPSHCTPREPGRDDPNNQDTTIPPTSGVEDDSNNEDASPSIPPTSGVYEDADSGENTSPGIPTKGGGLDALDDDKILSPP
jgi:hypothetical protein